MARSKLLRWLEVGRSERDEGIRCRFYAMCHQKSEGTAYHPYLGKTVRVCGCCARSNQYLVRYEPYPTATKGA